MTCSEVGQHLHTTVESDSTALPASVREHLKNCAPCREIWDFLTGRETSPPISAALQEKITGSVVDSLEPVKPLTCAWKLALGFFCIFALMSFGFVAVSGIQGAIGMGVIPFTVVLGLTGVAALLVAITLSREMAPGSPRLLSPTVLFFGLLAVLFSAVALLFPWEPDPNFLAHTWHCFSHGLMVSVPVAVLAVLLLRRGFVLSMEVAGAGAGMLSGLAGMKVLHFGCTMYSAPHVAAAHFGIAVAGALIGYCLGRFVPHLTSRPG